MKTSEKGKTASAVTETVLFPETVTSETKENVSTFSSKKSSIKKLTVKRPVIITEEVEVDFQTITADDFRAVCATYNSILPIYEGEQGYFDEYLNFFKGESTSEGILGVQYRLKDGVAGIVFSAVSHNYLIDDFLKKLQKLQEVA